MDKEIKKGFQKIKDLTAHEEKDLVKKDIKRDKKCEYAGKMAKNKGKKRK